MWNWGSGFTPPEVNIFSSLVRRSLSILFTVPYFPVWSWRLCASGNSCHLNLIPRTSLLAPGLELEKINDSRKLKHEESNGSVHANKDWKIREVSCMKERKENNNNNNNKTKQTKKKQKKQQQQKPLSGISFTCAVLLPRWNTLFFLVVLSYSITLVDWKQDPLMSSTSIVKSWQHVCRSRGEVIRFQHFHC